MSRHAPADLAHGASDSGDVVEVVEHDVVALVEHLEAAAPRHTAEARLYMRLPDTHAQQLRRCTPSSDCSATSRRLTHCRLTWWKAESGRPHVRLPEEL